MIGEVKGFERGTDTDGALVSEVKVDQGGSNLVTAELFEGPGVDAPPLDGDLVALVEGPGRGTKLAVAAWDPKNAGKAAPGEYRVIARDPVTGAPALELWMKGNGDADITSIKPGGKVTINGVEIDQQGNLKAPGEVTAKAASPTTSVTLSLHTHPTGTGPSGPPQPGT